MIRLRIDSVVCDLAAEQPLTLAWSGRTLTDPEAGRSGEALTFELLPTAAAEALFGSTPRCTEASCWPAARRSQAAAYGWWRRAGTARSTATAWSCGAGRTHGPSRRRRGGSGSWR